MTVRNSKYPCSHCGYKETEIRRDKRLTQSHKDIQLLILNLISTFSGSKFHVVTSLCCMMPQEKARQPGQAAQRRHGKKKFLNKFYTVKTLKLIQNELKLQKFEIICCIRGEVQIDWRLRKHGYRWKISVWKCWPHGLGKEGISEQKPILSSAIKLWFISCWLHQSK